MCRRKNRRHCLDSAVPWDGGLEAFGEAWATQRPDQAKPSRQRDLRHVPQICSVAYIKVFLQPGTTPNGRTVCVQERDQAQGAWSLSGKVAGNVRRHGSPRGRIHRIIHEDYYPDSSMDAMEPYLEIRQGLDHGL
ncbi:hypothetical protein H0G86_006063 [Trichoderma simmonsii]|uniref:Uncharacterized protein n=1 Tax=Trichoderma simmonsii TaxID=1491479 RepID=A0A8G0LDU4_9HYPO|nr:hypothetical protein H0G86_006063 [Trichoderma simmonsii]